METWGDWAYLHALVKGGGTLEAGEVPEPLIRHEICTRPFPSQRLLLHRLLWGRRVSCPCYIFDGVATLSHAPMGDSNKLTDSLS